MGVMIVTVVVVALLTLVGTVVWWAMMNDWEAKDRAARGRHVTDRVTDLADGNRYGGTGGSNRADGASGPDDDDGSDGPIVMKL